jgi:hypothetical protein
MALLEENCTENATKCLFGMYTVDLTKFNAHVESKLKGKRCLEHKRSPPKFGLKYKHVMSAKVQRVSATRVLDEGGLKRKGRQDGR